MIRTAILACALVAVPSAALAQSQVVLPEVRMLRLPAAAADDGPPADYINGIAPEYNGWIYQDTIPAPSPSQPMPTSLYRGDGYPATIMVCPRMTVTLHLDRRDTNLDYAGDNRCHTVTTDDLAISSSGRLPVKFRYRILAVHRAAE